MQSGTILRGPDRNALSDFVHKIHLWGRTLFLVDQLSFQTRSFPPSGPFFPGSLMLFARSLVILTWTYLLLEQTRSFRILWHESKILFSIPVMISVPMYFLPFALLRQVLLRTMLLTNLFLMMLTSLWSQRHGLHSTGFSGGRTS